MLPAVPRPSHRLVRRSAPLLILGAALAAQAPAHAAAPITTESTVPFTCTATSQAVGSAVLNIAARYRTTAPAAIDTTDPVSVSTTVELLIPAEATNGIGRPADSPRIKWSSWSVKAGPSSVQVPAASVGSVELSGGGEITPPTRGVAHTAPLPAGPSYVLGAIAPGATAVTASTTGFSIDLTGAGADTVDGLPIPAWGHWDCVPADSTPVYRIPIGPQPEPEPTDRVYAANGSATLRTLTKGSVALNGSVTLAGPFTGPTTGTIPATLALQPATASLVSLGFLPLKATVTFQPTEVGTAQILAKSVQINAKARIKLSNVSFGGIPIAASVGNCQTKQLSALSLRSTNEFTFAGGGTVAGQFAISNLAGCGNATGLLSTLTAGSGNAMLLRLAPAPKAKPTT